MPTDNTEHPTQEYYATDYCKYNPDGVMCATEGRKCWRCGWCPRVEQKRIKKLREALKWKTKDAL